MVNVGFSRTTKDYTEGTKKKKALQCLGTMLGGDTCTCTRCLSTGLASGALGPSAGHSCGLPVFEQFGTTLTLMQGMWLHCVYCAPRTSPEGNTCVDRNPLVANHIMINS